MLASRRSCCHAGIADYSWIVAQTVDESLVREDVDVVHNLRQKNPIGYPANESLICLVAGVEAHMTLRKIQVERSSLIWDSLSAVD